MEYSEDTIAEAGRRKTSDFKNYKEVQRKLEKDREKDAGDKWWPAKNLSMRATYSSVTAGKKEQEKIPRTTESPDEIL